ncbi:hypothetical protein ABZY02_18920 [Streptomyces sp. NPDC006649]|uniref:hypothetical protein n=1 Tax=Streptomyces sp. NPDC006649 TaxID=3156896 RepID=UPI0033A63D96
MIARGYQSVGRVDPNVAATVANAWAAGMSRVDVYHFPCFTCGNPAGQANALFTYLKDNDVKYGKVWLDVEGPGTYWGSSTSDNAAFIADWFAAMKEKGVDIGVQFRPRQVTCRGRGHHRLPAIQAPRKSWGSCPTSSRAAM